MPTAMPRPSPCAWTSASETSAAPDSLRSPTTTWAPASANRTAMARPIPEAAPVTRATRPASSRGLGARLSLCSSIGQYSTSKVSVEVSGAKPPSPAVVTSTWIARSYSALATAAWVASRPVVMTPTPGTSTTRGAGSSIVSAAPCCARTGHSGSRTPPRHTGTPRPGRPSPRRRRRVERAVARVSCGPGGRGRPARRWPARRRPAGWQRHVPPSWS